MYLSVFYDIGAMLCGAEITSAHENVLIYYLCAVETRVFFT